MTNVVGHMGPMRGSGVVASQDSSPLPRSLEEIRKEKKRKEKKKEIYRTLITKMGIVKKIYFFCSEFPRATSKINFNFFK
jgi:hypothetical protein